MQQRIHPLLAIIGCLMMSGSLFADQAPPRILFLIAHGFNRMEHFESLYSLTALGYTVDVASFEAGTVLLDPANSAPDTQGRDASANLAMREIEDISAYLALVIPGGYSAGNLEDDPEAIRLVRAFDQAGKPIGSICHAARLLAGAGIARGRVITGWNEIASEIPERWVSGEVGIYLDQEVVIDGNIIACRYPNDVGPWLRTFTRVLAERGGIPPPASQASALLFAAGKTTGHLRQMTQLGARNNNLTINMIHDATSLRRMEERLAAGLDVDIVLVYPDEASQALYSGEAGKALLASLGQIPLHHLQSNPPELQLREALALALRYGRQVPVVESQPYGAVLAIAPGFDERVAIAMEAFLRWRGLRILVVSHERGWVRGLQGLPLFAEATYEDVPVLAPQAIIVAPGGLWPREDPSARQAHQPDWLNGQAARDARRAAWVTERYRAGDTLVLFGFDSLYLTADSIFDGLDFAASEQTVWSFRQRSAGNFAVGKLALRSAERLYSARGFEALPELWQLLSIL